MTSENSAKVVVCLTPSELYRANLAIVTNRRSRWQRVRSQIWFGLAVFSLTWMWVRLSNPNISIFATVVRSAFFFALFSLFVLAVVRFGAYYGARKLIRTKPSILEPITYEISTDGVGQTSATGSAQSKWAAYLRIIETNEFFLFYPQDYLAYIITKGSFASDDEIDRFRDIVRENFQGKLKLLK